MLRDIAAPDRALSQGRSAIRWIKEHYTEAVEVEQLARMTSMSASAFHRHFKAVTAMSPIQFQKRIRLLQARQLLISQSANASAVAYDVGYESASQFTREYADSSMLGSSDNRPQRTLRRSANGSTPDQGIIARPCPQTMLRDSVARSSPSGRCRSCGPPPSSACSFQSP